MKILVLYSSNVAVCGIGTWIELLSDAVGEKGHEVVVGLAWGSRFHCPDTVERARPRLRTVRMDGRTGTEEGRVEAIERTIRREYPDVVVVTCLDSAFEAVRRLRDRGMTSFKFLVANHGNLPEHAARIIEQGDVVDLCVCVGRLACLAMKAQQGADGFPVLHIPNAVRIPSRSSDPGPRTTFRVGYAGRLYDFKRSQDLFPLLDLLSSRLPDAELWIAGEGPHGGPLREIAAREPRRLRFFGVLSTEQLYSEFYPSLDALIHFSASEGFGLAIAEAMAHGVVPVSAAFDGWRTEGLIHDGVNGLVFPVGDVGAAVDRLEMLSRDRELARRLSVAAAEHIREQYSSEGFKAQWCRTLEDLVASPTRLRSAPPGPALIPRLKELVRRSLGLRVPHGGAGEEWPHFRHADPALVAQMKESMNRLEGS